MQKKQTNKRTNEKKKIHKKFDGCVGICTGYRAKLAQPTIATIQKLWSRMMWNVSDKQQSSLYRSSFHWLPYKNCLYVFVLNTRDDKLFTRAKRTVFIQHYSFLTRFTGVHSFVCVCFFRFFLSISGHTIKFMIFFYPFRLWPIVAPSNHSIKHWCGMGHML